MLCALFLPTAYPIREWSRIQSTTVLMVTRRLFPRERQKSVSSMACAKLLRDHCSGRERIPEMLFVISVGCLKAITIVIYSGNATVIRPMHRRIVTGQFTLDFIFSYIITVPPSYLI